MFSKKLGNQKGCPKDLKKTGLASAKKPAWIPERKSGDQEKKAVVPGKEAREGGPGNQKKRMLWCEAKKQVIWKVGPGDQKKRKIWYLEKKLGVCKGGLEIQKKECSGV